MSKGVACPNRACPHVFSRAEVLQAETICCPVCGARCRLRAGSEPGRDPRPPERHPLARRREPVLPQPQNGRGPSAAPASPPGSTPLTLEFEPAASDRSPPTPMRTSWGRIAFWTVFAILSGLGMLIGYAWLGGGMEPEHRHEGPTVSFPSYHCRFLKPGRPWMDETGSPARTLRTLVCMRREQPRAWLALWIQETPGGESATPDFRKIVLERLGRYFAKDSLRVDAGERGTVAGNEATRFVFNGQAEDQWLAGECYLLESQQTHYGLMAWAPASEIETTQAEFADLRRRFAFLGPMPGRQDAAKNGHRFEAEGQSLSLADEGSVWKPWLPATDFDPLASLALVAKEREAIGIAPANLLVLRLAPEPASLDEAVSRAIAHLEAQQKSIYPQTKVERLPLEVGPPADRVIALHIINGENRERYGWLAVLLHGHQCWVVQGECAWSSRTLWQPRFQALLASLHWGDERGTQGGDSDSP